MTDAAGGAGTVSHRPPSVSVVIPHYNSADSLERALRSVAAQTLPVREVIVVDDGSSAAQAARARELTEAGPRGRFIALAENAGPATARNRGWDAATGEWVAFLDSDDAWHAQKLAAVFGAVRAIPTRVDLIASRTVRVARVADLDAIAIPRRYLAKRVRIWNLLWRNSIATTSVVLRRSIRSRFSVGRRHAEDYELWLTIVGTGHPAVFLDLELSAMFKAAFGDSGLSARIGQMILGEYRAYLGAWRQGALDSLQLALGVAFSSLRSIRRVLQVFARRIAATRR